MEAKELRIGNLVEYKITDSQDERKEWWELNPIDVFDLQHLVEFPEDGFFRPIPLTDEWLKKLGFKRGGYDMIEVWHPEFPRVVMVGYLDEEEDEERYMGWNYNMSGETEEEYGSSRVKIRHVHQLQNLYFALTGEELTSIATPTV